jgi:hypothetical protein
VTTTVPGMQLALEGQPRLAAGRWRVDPARSHASFAASVAGRPVRDGCPCPARCEYRADRRFDGAADRQGERGQYRV